MSREEREEAYNKARERIFGTASTETSTPDNEDSTGVSRASSVSLRDKANGKKSRRRRDSDTFETRSNYVAYAPGYGHSHQPTWVQPQYLQAQYTGAMQQQYPGPAPAMYGPPAQGYLSMMPGNGVYGPQYNEMSNVGRCVKGTSKRSWVIRTLTNF